MPRNLFRRIEVVFPVEDGNLRERLIRDVLGVSLGDNVEARFLGADGSYHKAALPNGAKPQRSQRDFISLAEVGERRTVASKRNGAKYPAVRVTESPFAPRKK